MSPLNADLAWVLIAVIVAWMVLGCLKTIGYGYYNAVRWHNLKIQVHNLRNEQKRRLLEMDGAKAARLPAARPVPDADVIIVGPIEDEPVLPAGEERSAEAAA